MNKNLVLSLFAATVAVFFSASSFAKPLLNCHSKDGSSILVTLVDKTALVAEVTHGAQGTQAIQRSGSIVAANVLNDAEIQVSDASGVFLSVGSEGAPGALSGFYIHSDGKSSGVDCSLN